MNQTFSQVTDRVKPNGGNAVKGVVRINQENVSWTFQNFIEVLGRELCLNRSHTAIIGSAGKKASGESSGDIDIAIEIPNMKYLKFNIYDFIVDELEWLGYAFKDMRQIGIISLAYPIMNYDDNQKGKFVQIDLMIVDSIEYAKWGYYSPSYTHSQYKGLYRNELNFFIAKHAELEPTKYIDDVPVEWSRYWFSTKDGLLYGKQTIISEKTGKLIKTPRVIEKKLVTNDPDKVARFLYGQGCDSDLVLTLEDAIREMKDCEFPYTHLIPLIIKDTIQGIESKGYPVPDIIRSLIT